MDTVLQSAARRFRSEEHIRNVLAGDWSPLFDGNGDQLKGIRGRVGAAGTCVGGYEIGADLIEMQPGSEFPLHSHEGDHILCVLEGKGLVHIDGVNHPVGPGDTVYVPAEYPHGVRTHSHTPDVLRFLAVGYPHKHLEATDRMHIVSELEPPHPTH